MITVRYESKDKEKIHSIQECMHNGMVGDEGYINCNTILTDVTPLSSDPEVNAFCLLVGCGNESSGPATTVDLDNLKSGFIKDGADEIACDFDSEKLASK